MNTELESKINTKHEGSNFDLQFLRMLSHEVSTRAIIYDKRAIRVRYTAYTTGTN